MKIKIKIAVLLMALTGIAVSSCDIIEEPYNEKPVIPVDTNKYVRNVLLEEYTGFRCGNCPAAADVAAQLHEIYGDRIVLLRVHAGGYAIPKGTHKYDFRTPEATELDAFFGCSNAGNPNGLISRTGYPNGHILRSGAWETAITDLLAKQPKMNIELTVSYSEQDSLVSGSWKVKYLKDGAVNDNICLYIVEDSIIQYQTDYRKTPEDIDDYNHMHIFRKALNGTWGEPLSATAPKTGDMFQNTFSFKPDYTKWNPKNLVIVAFVHDNAGSYEIWQVAQAKVRK